MNPKFRSPLEFPVAPIVTGRKLYAIFEVHKVAGRATAFTNESSDSESPELPRRHCRYIPRQTPSRNPSTGRKVAL